MIPGGLRARMITEPRRGTATAVAGIALTV